MTDTASGRELLSGSASAKGVVQDCTTGMEARIMGEAAIADRRHESERGQRRCSRQLVSSYEKGYAKAPKGKSFRECYDVQKIVPTPEHQKVYDDAVAKLRDMGLSI